MMYAGLTQGAIAAILAHGTDEQKRPVCRSWSTAPGPAP